MDSRKQHHIETIENICLSGGGTKCISHLGAIQCLMDRKLVSHKCVFYGTSAGSIIAFLLCIGYTPIEIMVYISTTDMFNEMSRKVSIRNMITGSGILDFSLIENTLRTLTENKIGVRNITMKELYDKHGRVFYATAFNVTRDRVEYISHNTHPDIDCITALKLSSSIPLVFSQSEYAGCTYIDGGIVDNLPVSIIDKNATSKNTIVIAALDAHRDTRDTVQASQHTCIENQKSILAYISRMLTIPVRMKTLEKVNTCAFPVVAVYVDISSIDFNVSTTKQLDIFSHGYTAAKSVILH